MNYQYQYRRPKERSVSGKGVFVKLARQTAVVLCILLMVLMFHYVKTGPCPMVNEKIEEIMNLDYSDVVVNEATKRFQELEVLISQLLGNKAVETGFRFEYLPVQGEITSSFGKRTNPITKLTENHEGIDISVKEGSDVKSAISGVVEKVGNNGNLGIAVVIDHQNGFRTIYGHLSKANVKVGEKVVAGAVIAKSGNTGLSTGPHLHFEVRQGKDAVNPLKLLVGQSGSYITI